MPCNCDHMYPTKREEESILVRKLLTSVGLRCHGDDSSCNVYVLDQDTDRLCQYCRVKHTQKMMSEESLVLQRWWIDHQISDLEKKLNI